MIYIITFAPIQCNHIESSWIKKELNYSTEEDEEWKNEMNAHVRYLRRKQGRWTIV